MSDQTQTNPDREHEHEWIRGVNIGGWLMAERFITPYLFAVNSCHLQGSLCYYPGQIGLDTSSSSSEHEHEQEHEHEHELCETETLCRPVLVVKGKEPTDYHLIRGIKGDGTPTRIRAGINQEGMDYPMDEFTLGQVLRTSSGGIETATRYMERHWETFLTYDDLKTLKANGVTHLRIPMGYWIRGIPGLSLLDDEPYIPGGWKYFVRAANWCRELGLVVWADLHGAPGSENGFDNSGHYLGGSTCDGWSKHPANVQRTLEILTDIANGVLEEGLGDVVTGFGILNEPFADCDFEVLLKYYDDALTVLRATLGESTSVFVGDTFRAFRFNDGKFWTDPEIYHDTYLDSHPYHVFFEEGRSFTPRQHIAYVCRHDTSAVSDCCFQDGPSKQIPSAGISRLTGEWSGAFDSLPTALVPEIMEGISKTGQLPQRNRTLSAARKDFIRNFCEAQMVAYEAADSGGVSKGWLFWNFKMEGGAFAEWDFLRGLSEGWMPPIPDPKVSSESLYGTCLDIYNKTDDSYSIIEEYPDPRTLDWNQWQGWSANDDFVKSDPNIPADHGRHYIRPWWDTRRLTDAQWFFPASCALAVSLVLLMHRKIRRSRKGERLGYTELKV